MRACVYVCAGEKVLSLMSKKMTTKLKLEKETPFSADLLISLDEKKFKRSY